MQLLTGIITKKIHTNTADQEKSAQTNLTPSSKIMLQKKFKRKLKEESLRKKNFFMIISQEGFLA